VNEQRDIQEAAAERGYRAGRVRWTSAGSGSSCTSNSVISSE
jgi:hypothetical protein